MYNHYRKTRKRYKRTNGADTQYVCNFCDGITPDQVILGTEHCWLVRNRVPYDTWEHHKVLDHLIVVPKRHVHLLGELTETELSDVMKLCLDHEAKGYSVYARGDGSPRRSAHHQHTHLIRIGTRVAKAGLYLEKPYVNISL